MGYIFGGAAMLGTLVLLTSAISLWFAWAAAILWGWFMVPMFSAPVLTTTQCWAITLTVSLFFPRLKMTKADPSEFWSALGSVFLVPPISLGIGWAIKTWLM